MRKIFVTMAAMIMALIMSVTAFGCNLVVVNSEKDMAQVVAVVKIEEGVPEEGNTIYKRDMVLAYLNYGYYYEQNGYTRQQVIDLIIDNLIVSRVYLQAAIIEFAEGGVVNTAITDKWNVERYLTNDELAEAEYRAEHDMDELIHSYEEHDHGTHLGDTITETVRTVPTGATNQANKAEDPSLEEMKAFEIDTDSTDSRKKAYSDVIELLEVNSLLGDYKNDIKETDYYKQSLKGYQEQLLIEKYEKSILAPIHAKYTMDSVRALYGEELAKQKEWDDADYSAALSSATAENPILYAPTGTYGYVYNLLIGVGEKQTNELNEYDADNPNATNAERSAARKGIFDKITVKDLRSTWLLSGYDFADGKFTGDYTFTSAENSLKFFGEVEHLNAGHEDDEHYSAEYGIKSLTEMSIEEFVKMMEEYVYGSVQEGVETTDSAVYKAVKTNVSNDEYEERINELLFAFSTDGGSLNTYKGYVISPVPDGSNQETYMQEFADYGRKVINGEYGEKGYVMVATDYGYHVMFFSEAYASGVVYDSLDAFLEGECEKFLDDGETWEKYFKDMQDNWTEFEDTTNYLYVLYNKLVSAEIQDVVTKYQENLKNTYIYGENSKVVKYESRYADLMGN